MAFLGDGVMPVFSCRDSTACGILWKIFPDPIWRGFTGRNESLVYSDRNVEYGCLALLLSENCKGHFHGSEQSTNRQNKSGKRSELCTGYLPGRIIIYRNDRTYI